MYKLITMLLIILGYQLKSARYKLLSLLCFLVFFLSLNELYLIESKGANIVGKITSLNKDYPIITVNKYGKGIAIYIGIPARETILNPIINELLKTISVNKGPETPNGIMARYINKNHILYLNLSSDDKSILIKGAAKSILTGNNYVNKFTLKPFETEFIELN